VSVQVLKVAKENAKAHSHTSTYQSGKIKFIKSDLLKNVRGEFDVIVANLPYGWQAWKNNSSTATIGLKYEPSIALFTQEKGLNLIRQLLQQIANLKYKPKAVYLEFDPRQKTSLTKLIKKHLPSWEVRFYKDFGNLWRFCEITSEGPLYKDPS
jgi:methylase of polypeptide subunit release factors